MKRIGKGLFILGFVCFRGVWASEVAFFAEVEPKVVGLGDEVTLTLTTQADTEVSLGEVRFEAPDFEQISESNSISSQSQSIFGRDSTVITQKIIKVLLPKRVGRLQISGIQMRIGSSFQKVRDLSVQVEKTSVSSPRNFRRPGLPQMGLPQMRRNFRRPSAADHKKCFLQAEAEQGTVFKGQQVEVSYALYCQVQVLSAVAEKHPSFSGFLKEDFPVRAGDQKSEVVVGGERYLRHLITRYLLYPLQEGELFLDPLSVSYQYQGSGGSWEDEDPFFGFFQQMRPQVGSAQSAAVSIRVLGLPEEGRPSSWSGGIGKFSLEASLDRSEVPAHEAVTLTLKVEGSGNLSAIKPPQATYPPSIELYDTKGRMEGEGKRRKIFEFLLVPRTPGKVVLPSQVLSFFDPSSQQYYTLKTEPLSLVVLEPLPGKAPPAGVAEAPEVLEKKEVQDLRYLKAPGEEWAWFYAWRWLYPLAILLVSILGGWCVWDRFRSRSPKVRRGFQRDWWNQLQQRVASESFSWEKLSEVCDQMVEEVLTTVDSWYDLNWRSVSRKEWKRLLIEEKAMDEGVWEKIHAFLVFAEQVRFSHRKQASWESSARSDLLSWIQALTEALGSFQ
jgi:hypothetical protein